MDSACCSLLFLLVSRHLAPVVLERPPLSFGEFDRSLGLVRQRGNDCRHAAQYKLVTDKDCLAESGSSRHERLPSSVGNQNVLQLRDQVPFPSDRDSRSRRQAVAGIRKPADPGGRLGQENVETENLT